MNIISNRLFVINHLRTGIQRTDGTRNFLVVYSYTLLRLGCKNQKFIQSIEGHFTYYEERF